MEKQIITFSANEQRLIKTGGIECYASNIVSYIEAHFDLGANWSGYDSVRAVWSNDNNMTVISTVLDSNGVCIVPFEVLKTKGIVKVNLVGSISVSDVLTDRLTTFPCEAVKVTAKAKIEGSETQPITPSQFEQFVAVVISEVEKVTGMTAQAETLPAGSQATARYENGILYLGIPQGIQGERGETGADGNGIAQVLYNSDYSITFVFTNGERFTTPSLRGETGPQGQPGQNGRDGTDGRDGADGVTPSLSVGTVTTLPSTEDAYVTRTGTDENPVFNFGIPQGPKGEQGEVTMSQLSSLLPTDTASGSIASFPDGTDLFPALSVKAQIEPIQSGSGTPSPDNVRPISGHTEVVTEVCGKNLFGASWELGTISTSTGADIASTTALRCGMIPLKGGQTYAISWATQSLYILLFAYKSDGTFSRYIRAITASGSTVDINSDEAYFRMVTYNNTTEPTEMQIELGSATDYEPYQAETYTTTLGRTVYGGTLDVVSGELVVDRVIVTYNGTESWAGDGRGSFYIDCHDMKKLLDYTTAIVCDKMETFAHCYVQTFVDASEGICGYLDGNNVYPNQNWIYAKGGGATTASAFKAWLADNPLQVVYKLATPQTYQLDPQTIDLLLGQNNLWTDCGSVEVTYKADVGLYIDKKLSSNGTRSLSMGLTKSATAEAETETEPSKTETETKTEEAETETEPSKTDTETR